MNEAIHNSRISDHITIDLLNKNNLPYQTKTLAKGNILLTIDDPATYIYLITTGHFKVYISDENGREVTLNTLSRGEVIGELSAITGHNASANIVATEKSEIIQIKQSDFIALLKSETNIMFQLLKYLAIRSQKLSVKAADFILLDVFGRVTALLTEHLRNNAVEGLSHQDIASEVGSSREMTSKILGMLKNANFIEIGRKKITVLKPLPTSLDNFNNT